MPKHIDHDRLVFPKETLYTKPGETRQLDHLTRLLRVIMYQCEVTGNDFVKAHTAAHIKQYGHGERLMQALHNFRKSIRADIITWRTFRIAVTQLLRFRLVRISITVQSHDGVEQTFHSDADVEETHPVRNDY